MLAWNQHGPRSEPGPVASLAFWKQTLRTVLRAAPRSRVLMGVPTWGWQWNGPRAPEPSRRRRRELFPKATRDGAAAALRRARGHHAWVESDRSRAAQAAHGPQARIAGVALWVRGGESSATWRQPLLSPGPAGGTLSR